MDQRQDHIATLCAVATVGIAATGFALGTIDTDLFLVNPGKRKAPGSDVIRPATTSHVPPRPRRTISQPSVPVIPHEPPLNPHKSSSSSLLFRRKTVRDTDQNSTRESLGTESRGSSHSRLSSFHRPWTANRDSSAERKESRPNSSWLKRLSNMSSLSNSSFAPSVSQVDTTSVTSTPSTSVNALELPNKLIKRSSSRRIASAGGTQPSLLRRPMTSHHRSATVAEIHLHDSEVTAHRPERVGRSTSSPTYRPFFDYTPARKRHTSTGQSEPILRTISATFGQKPTLVLGTSVQPPTPTREHQDIPLDKSVSSPPPNVRQRLRRSLGSVNRGAKQRNFTEPIVHVTKQDAHGSIIPVSKDSSLSPLSNISTFDIQFSQGTPSFTSSPPLLPSTPARFTLHKRSSVAPSDPTTASSDNDGRVFTDDDSMDFQSDTVYDSLATRATASSHSGLRHPKVDTIFDEPSSMRAVDEGLESMMKRATLTDDVDSEMIDHSESKLLHEEVGLRIDGLDELSESGSQQGFHKPVTPDRAPPMEIDDLMATPVPTKRTRTSDFGSSPPFMLQGVYQDGARTSLLSYPEEMDFEDERIDWSPELPDIHHTSHSHGTNPRGVSSSSRHSECFDANEPTSDRTSSVFDWSEPNNNFGNELVNGCNPRPMTGYGRYGNNLSRSRHSGRRPGGATHFRSQSVPVNRDSLADMDVPLPTAKFGTWNLGLGHKGVSEEWSDDFEFDEATEENADIVGKALQHDSIRSVKIPQTIIDRQASVHLQFGQVQEFMLFVEELKRLRVRGMDLQIVDEQSSQLWDDAESIVNLATMDEEPDLYFPPGSPTSSDLFGDETPPSKVTLNERSIRTADRAHSTPNHRIVSSSATPSSGRPRSESLAQAKNLLQSIHQTRNSVSSSPAVQPSVQRDKLPFDSQDLRELVIRAGAVTKALKELVRRAEGVPVSPVKTPQRGGDPSFRQIFDPPDASPCAPFPRPGLSNSRSANSYLGSATNRDSSDELPRLLNFAKAVEAN